MVAFERSLGIGSALIVLSVLASKIGSRLGVPALLLFLAMGMVAGPHGFSTVHFSSFRLAQELGTIALIFILFSGGLSTEIANVRRVLAPALVLSTLGVLIATIVVGWFSVVALKFTWIEGLLLGATVASTDVAAVFSVLRSKNLRLKTEIAALLELESALNDPMAVFLGIVLLSLAANSAHFDLSLVGLFFREMAVGCVAGWISGRAASWIINRIHLEYDGLYPVLSLGWILLTYALTQRLDGSGFLACYLTGIVIGNAQITRRQSFLHFHEGLAWLGQIGMFLAMGLLVKPHDLWLISGWGLVLSLVLVFAARPLSVFICLPWSRFRGREKIMISWAGLRGAVPIILASYVLASHTPKSSEIFNLVFFVTFVSVLLQGTTLSKVAKWLGCT